MFKKERDRAVTTPKALDLKPPYPEKVAEKDFPTEYKVPKFQKFDGRKVNMKEHVSRFLDSLGKYEKYPELWLREFSKSLTYRAYTWYLSLKPGTIQDWEDMVGAFNTKFFFAEAKYTLVELGRTRQYAGEGLDLYVKRFHDKALDCVDRVDEEVLVNVCLHGMNDEYLVFLENLTFSSFSKLMEAARRTNESVRRTPKANRIFPTTRPFAKRKQAVAAVEADHGSGPSSHKKPTQRPDNREYRQKKKSFLHCHLFLVKRRRQHRSSNNGLRILLFSRLRSAQHPLQPRKGRLPIPPTKGTHPGAVFHFQEDLRQEAGRWRNYFAGRKHPQCP